MKSNVRIALIEDSAEYRRQLSDVVNARLGWQVVAESGNVTQALQRVPASRPDLVLLDLLLAEESAVDLIPRLRTQLPGVPIVILTVVDAPDQIVLALQAGASGYILKGDPAAALLDKIEDAIAGGAAMNPAVARRLVAWFQQPQVPADRDPQGLTEREWEVLRLSARGKQHGEIAMILHIAVSTVKNHFRNIYEKLGVRSLTEALIKLNNGRGLLDSED